MGAERYEHVHVLPAPSPKGKVSHDSYLPTIMSSRTDAFSLILP